MPLAFHSSSHGSVAFGFFNIDSDMLLLEQEFFFATDFCRALADLARSRSECAVVAWDGFHIANRSDVGDLMGAIHGVRHTGFIGETYRRFPFPERPEDFRQRPEGAENRETFASTIARFGEPRAMRLVPDPSSGELDLAGFRFERGEFWRLVDYVWLGGYPRWRGGVRPDYVEQMAQVVAASSHWAFEGIELSPRESIREG